MLTRINNVIAGALHSIPHYNELHKIAENNGDNRIADLAEEMASREMDTAKLFISEAKDIDSSWVMSAELKAAYDKALTCFDEV